MKIGVAIFAKTIGLSPVKTRLAADIGTEQAEAFYHMSKNCVEAIVSAAQAALPGTLFPAWVLAEQDGPSHVAPDSFPAFWTGEGGLGRRLANVSEAFFKEYDGVILMGTDSPHLQPTVLLETINLLEDEPEAIVVGPARDGGFYLFASRQPVCRKIWEKVTYSCDSTLQELEWLLDAKGLEITRLDVETDVDLVSDLKLVTERLSRTDEGVLPEQVHLKNWIEKNLSDQSRA